MFSVTFECDTLPHIPLLLLKSGTQCSSHSRQLLDAGQLISISFSSSLGGGQEREDGTKPVPDKVGGRTPSEDLGEKKK